MKGESLKSAKKKKNARQRRYESLAFFILKQIRGQGHIEAQVCPSYEKRDWKPAVCGILVE